MAKMCWFIALFTFVGGFIVALFGLYKVGGIMWLVALALVVIGFLAVPDDVKRWRAQRAARKP
jgi:hypothetical protein